MIPKAPTVEARVESINTPHERIGYQASIIIRNGFSEIKRHAPDTRKDIVEAWSDAMRMRHHELTKRNVTVTTA